MFSFLKVDGWEYLPEQKKRQIADAAFQGLETEASEHEITDRTQAAINGHFSAELARQRYKDLTEDPIEEISTGYSQLDKMLNGGFPKAAVVGLMAAPGTGKTTLMQQISEGIAKNGTPVLFINLEMSERQLLAKSVSRILASKGKDFTVADILKHANGSKEEVEKAEDEYFSNYSKVKYNPDGMSTDLQNILKIIKGHCFIAKLTQQPIPVIVIDYLHLITSSKDEVQTIKDAVAAFKKIAIEYQTTVFLITASNRESNKSRVEQTSGRDSSAIEYSTDVLLTMNYAAVVTPTIQCNKCTIKVSTKANNSKLEKMSVGEIKDEMAAAIAEGKKLPLCCTLIELRVVKGRFTEGEAVLYLMFDGRHNRFLGLDSNVLFEELIQRDLKEARKQSNDIPTF